MKNYINFNAVISAMVNGGDIDINGKTVSFFDVDPVILGYAKIFQDISDMRNRQHLLNKHEYAISRMVRTLTREIIDRLDNEYIYDPNPNCPDKYSLIIYNLLNIGIAPDAALFNILQNTYCGTLMELPYTVCDDAMISLTNKNENCFDVVNSDFFEEYVALKNFNIASELNEMLDINLPTNIKEWLERYEFSSYDCDYIRNHFNEFLTIYEKEVCGNE